mmetsp:Transcript_23405/g.51381  ORF Transcript_23405/g.51381 Transcript_23405/m.51381 type:complete len:603 (-) Transcript_23405:401-2209(-)
MTLKVNLSLDRVFYEPTEPVHATVQVINDLHSAGAQSQYVHIKELTFQAQGHERTDPSWISKLWQPDYKVESVEARKNIRTIFKTSAAMLLTNSPLPINTMHQFFVRFRLPPSIPPTFRGNSIRFSYSIDVRAVYEVSAGGRAPLMYETTATSSLLVWPPHTWRHLAPAGSLETAGSRPPLASTSSSYANIAALGGGGSQQPAGVPPSPRAAGDSVATDPAGESAPPHPSAAPAGPSSGEDGLEVPLLEYGLQQSGMRVRHQASALQDLATASLSPYMSLQTNGILEGVGNHLTQAVAGPQASMPNSPDAATRAEYLLAGRATPGQSQSALVPNAAHWRRRLAENAEYDSEDSDLEVMPPQLQRRLSTSSYASSRSMQPQQVPTPAHAAATPVSVAPTHQRPRTSSGVTVGGHVFGKSFVLSAAGTPVVKLMLQAPLDGPLQPGSSFSALLDFRPQPLMPQSPRAGQAPAPPALRCHQLVVMLETEEIISPEFKSRAATTEVPVGGAPLAKGSSIIRKLYCEHQEMTTDVAMSHVVFTVPAAATPSFRTPMVSMRWVLRFELSVGPPFSFASLDRTARAAPAMQQLVWSLPLVVVPPISPAP